MQVQRLVEVRQHVPFAPPTAQVTRDGGSGGNDAAADACFGRN